MKNNNSNTNFTGIRKISTTVKKISKKKVSKKSKKSKKHDDSSVSDSDLDVSSDEIYKRVQSYIPINQPIYYWWYDPYVYNLNSVFLPTFYSYLNPLMELSLKIN